ncbi:MAG: hypothetical protein KA761_00180 [Gemmatimonadaceae bacterium]|nr:hypothetical protein [Gemmatimonadaceae bacterium]
MFEAYRNPGSNTYNGVRLLADLTGLSEAEIAWTARRIAVLIHEEGRTKGDALRIVKDEVKSRPWERA